MRPSADALLEHAGFLRGLARRLLLDDAQADDAVQQTLLVALEKPPADPGNLRAWLTGVLKRVALMTRRTEGRRSRRQRAAARGEGLPSTAGVAARLETQRAVVYAVSALDEPYRSVVVYRFFDDLRPGEIARRLDVPVETVKTRLRRALARLRARLDADVEGGREAWTAALLPLALPAGGATAGTGAALLLKGLITMKTVAATGALAAAAVLFLVLRDPSAERDATPRPPSSRTGNASAERRGARDGDAFGAGADSERASPSSASFLLAGVLEDPGGTPVEGARLRLGERTLVSDESGAFALRHERVAATLSVEHPDFVRRTVDVAASGSRTFVLQPGTRLSLVVRDPAGTPLPDVRVRVAGTMFVLRYNPAGGFGPDREFQEFAETRTGSDGRAELGAVARRSVRVLLDHPRFARRTLELDLHDGEPVARDVRLSRGGTVRGRVTAPDGTPVAGARVWVRDDEGRAVRTGPDGTYTLALVEPGNRAVFAAAEGCGASAFGGGSGWAEALPVRVGEGQTVDGIDIALAPATYVVGRVVGPDGTPRGGLHVVAGVLQGIAGRLAEDVTAEDGTFRCGPLSPRPGTLLAVDVLEGKMAAAARRRSGVGPGTVDLGDLRLSAPARVAGRVVFADGRPAAGARVRARPRDVYGLVEVVAGADGAFAAPVAAGHVEVRAGLDGRPRHRSRPATFPLDPGGEKDDVTLVLHPVRTVTGVVRNADGTPRAMARVDAVEKEGDASDNAWTDGEGRFRFPGLPGDEYEVVVHGVPATRRTVRAGAGDIELIVPREGIAVTGHVLGADGEPVRDLHVKLTRHVLFVPRRLRGERVRTRAGRFEIGVREPGTYSLEIEADGFAPKTTERFAVGKEGEVDLGEIRLGPPGRVRGRVLDVAGDPVAYARVFLLGTKLEEPRNRPFTGRDGRFELGGVAPGTYNVFVVSPDHPLLLRQGVRVEEGGLVSLELRLADPSPLSIRVLDEGGRPLEGARLVYSLPQLPFLNSKRAARYEPPGFGRNVSGADGMIKKPSMPAGKVNLEVTAEGHVPEKRTVELAPNEAKTIEVRLRRKDD